MGLTNPNVKLTRFKKVSSMADMSQLDELPEEILCSCGPGCCAQDLGCNSKDSLEASQSTDNDAAMEMVGDFTNNPPTYIKVENSARKMSTGSENIVCDDENFDEEMIEEYELNTSTTASDPPSSPQPFRSGTLTRSSRRTSRELRHKEHVAHTEHCDDAHCEAKCAKSEHIDVSVEKSITEDENVLNISCNSTEIFNFHPDVDSIDGKVNIKIVSPTKSLNIFNRSDVMSPRGRMTLDSSQKGIFPGIGPRGGIRRHSMYSGYMTLPKMTGLVGLTLPDLKTRRKGESASPMSAGMAAILDLKIFKHDYANVITVHSYSSSRHAACPSTPIPNRPSTISYSSRFKNSIGRRRRSITSVENLFKSFRSISSPAPVLEEHEETESSTQSSNITARTFKKQISTSSLRSTYSGSSTSSSSSSCHSSPVTTPKLERKCVSPVQVSSVAVEEVLVQLNLEEIIHISEEFLCNSPSTTLSILKRHLENGSHALDDSWGASSASNGNAGPGGEDPSILALSCALRLHLTQFTRRLHLTRSKLEDTARCYHMLDKTYEWALEAMRAIGKVKGVGVASPDQVGAAAHSLAAHAHHHPPPTDVTFASMLGLATKLANTTLLHQVKVAESRCQETQALLQSRQAALVKARRQMEFDCQSFVDLNEVLESDDPSPFSWLVGTPLNSSGRRRSVTSTGSRPRESLSRCSSVETDDEVVFPENNLQGSSKQALETRTSLGGIKEVRESAEELDREHNISYSSPVIKQANIHEDNLSKNTHTKLSLTNNTRDFYNRDHSSLIIIAASTPISNPIRNSSTRKRYLSSTDSSNSSGSSGSYGSRDCAKMTMTPQAANHKSIQRANAWPFGETIDETAHQTHDGRSLPEDEDEEELMEVGDGTSSSEGALALPPSAANSHLLTRSSQLDISEELLTQEDSRKNIKLFHIISELIKTEQDYVLSLEYVIENYLPELLLDDIPQALRGQRNVIFGNIEKIAEFHRGYFLRQVKLCEKRPRDIGKVFLKYERQFYLYALYNKNKPKSDTLMAEYGSQFFRKKQLEIGDKMDLASYLLKPVQRMGKYALLLTQLVQLSSGTEAGSELAEAQQMVQFQLRHGNDLLAMDSLKDCDVNLKEQGQLLRQAEFVVLEGGRARKTTRHVFLFEDLILFSKGRKDPDKRSLDIFQYKHSMKMTDIGLTEQLDCNNKFEIWFRKRKPSDTYVLQTNSPEVKEAWTEEISKLLWRQALKNRTLRLHEMSSMGIGSKPCLDIRPSEDQINDRSVAVSYKQVTRSRLDSSVTSAESASLNVTAAPSGGSLRRPYSIISVSSSSSNSSSQPSSSSCSGGAAFVAGAINLGFDSGSSPRPLHRSVTRTSQCSAESGILADMYPTDPEDGNLPINSHLQNVNQNHYRIERSNSTVTTVSVDSALSPSTPGTGTPPTPIAASPASSGSSVTSPGMGPASPQQMNTKLLSSLATLSMYEQAIKNDAQSVASSGNPPSESSSVTSSGCKSMSSYASTVSSTSSSSSSSTSSSVPPVKSSLSSLSRSKEPHCEPQKTLITLTLDATSPVKTLLTTEV